MLQLRSVIAEEERLMEAAADIPALAQLRIAMKMFLQISWRHPALGRIVTLEGMAGGERLEWLNANLMGPRNRRLVELARAAVAAGVLKPFPPELLVVTLQAAGAGAINLSPLMAVGFGVDMSEPAARQAHESLILDALLGGLIVQTQSTQPASDRPDP
jgi:hypothetical protein